MMSNRMTNSTPPPTTRRRPGPRRAEGLPTGPDEVRRAVLDAAATLFAERGIAHVSLRDIAAAANVNLGLVRRYMGSRDELVRAVFEDLTAQLVDEIHHDPTGSRGFERDSVMGRWTQVLADLMVTEPDVAVDIGTAPVRELRTVIETVYGLPREAASLRVAQLFGSAIGWRLFEQFLVSSAGLDDMDLDDVRSELTRTHRRLGATPYPSPPDPKVRSK